MTKPKPNPDMDYYERSFFALVYSGMNEGNRAMKKFPQPNYVITKFAEEAGEVVKAALHVAENREEMDALRDEMKQVFAIMYRLWIEGDQVHGLKPVGDEGL